MDKMFPVLLCSAWPVMVQCEETHKRKSKYAFCFKPDVVCKFEVPVFCKLRQRRKPKIETTPQTLFSDATLNYPFLTDHKSTSLIRRSKILFIMRGLPGSGKSTVVKAITQSFQDSCVCSADDYFLQNGVYAFDAVYLSSAHETCQKKAKDACNRDVPVVVVDNTNVRRWEMKFYLELASHTDYVVVLVQPKTAWKLNPAELAAKNKHGVDVNILKRKVNQFDDVIPYYYAWFLNASASKQLVFISQCLLKECLQLFSAFHERLLKQLHISPSEYQEWFQQSDSSAKESFSGMFNNYYGRGNRAGCLLHCTAKFCGGGRAVGANTYHAQSLVQDSLGKASTLDISSICFSPRTVGARIQLGDSHLLLFDKPEEKSWDGKQKCSSPVQNVATGESGSTDNAQGARSSFPGHSKHKKDRKKRNSKSKNRVEVTSETPSSSSLCEGLEPAGTKPVANTTGRSAHITVGCAQGFESRETNFDVLRLCDMEASSTTTEADLVPVTAGKARYFGDGVCCVYFDPPLHVQAIYSGFY